MSETLNNFIHAAWARRKELTEIIFERTKGAVFQGPFRTMKILPKWEWGDSDCAGKLLGIYECELYDSVEEVINNQHDLIMNIGCAEGFYGVGFGMRTTAQIVMIDPFVAALNIARENARANKVNKILFSSESHPEVFRHYLQKYKNPFIFMDCEGHEHSFLNLETIPELSYTSVIVECHDNVWPGMTEEIKNRFKATHNIQEISQGAKNPYMSITHDLPDYDKVLLCCEERPMTMTWLYMVPKNESNSI